MFKKIGASLVALWFCMPGFAMAQSEYFGYYDDGGYQDDWFYDWYNGYLDGDYDYGYQDDYGARYYGDDEGWEWQPWQHEFEREVTAWERDWLGGWELEEYELEYDPYTGEVEVEEEWF